MTACVYLYISDENMMTKGLDQGVKKLRSLIPGDKGAKDDVSVKRWIFRDCISIKMDHKQGASKNETLNRCVPMDTEGAGQVHLCTCLSDKCNEPIGNIQGYLQQRSLGGDDGKSAARKDKAMIKVLISLALVATLAKI